MEAMLNFVNYCPTPHFTPKCLYISNLSLNLVLFVALYWEFIENKGLLGQVLPGLKYLVLLMMGSLLGLEGIKKRARLYVLLATFLWIYDTYVCMKVLLNPFSNDLSGMRILKGVHLVKFVPNFYLICYGFLICILTLVDSDYWLEWERQDLVISNGK